MSNFCKVNHLSNILCPILSSKRKAFVSTRKENDSQNNNRSFHVLDMDISLQKYKKTLINRFLGIELLSFWQFSNKICVYLYPN